MQADAARWWAGELERPLLQLRLYECDPERAAPALSMPYSDLMAYTPTITPEAIVDRLDYELAGIEFLGDAFPGIYLNFGSHTVAAFLDCLVEPGEHTAWFAPRTVLPIQELHFTYNPENFWLLRVKEICRLAMERWNGRAMINLPAMGGIFDILSAFRPSELLLYDLYDEPEEVKRLTWELHELWWRYFDEVNAVLQPVNPGFSTWAPLYSAEPYFMLQSDFCYMLGPEMFEEFVLPELIASCRRMPNAFYHLDGVGQLPHLEMILAIPELKGVQWIPGDGQPGFEAWPEVYAKIRDAGKLAQLWGDPRVIDILSRELGSLRGMAVMMKGDVSERATLVECLRRYGVPGE
jgi:5-methyltetrahydrofolate--homocysteine methyltransferase